MVPSPPDPPPFLPEHIQQSFLFHLQLRKRATNQKTEFQSSFPTTSYSHLAILFYDESQILGPRMLRDLRPSFLPLN